MERYFFASEDFKKIMNSVLSHFIFHSSFHCGKEVSNFLIHFKIFAFTNDSIPVSEIEKARNIISGLMIHPRVITSEQWKEVSFIERCFTFLRVCDKAIHWDGCPSLYLDYEAYKYEKESE